jgi:hypothetical protein
MDVLCAALLLALMAVPAVSGAPFRADYSTSSIAPAEGTQLRGLKQGEWVEWTVAGGGDVDGDGIADFVVGAYSADSLSGGGASQAGHAYVVYGVADPSDTAAAWPTNSTILSIAQDSTKGRIIDGAVAETYLGRIVAIVGDVNGDRLDDIATSSES